MKRFFKRIVILMMGLLIAHFGVTLFLQTYLGADPYNVLVQGLFRAAQRATGFKWLTHGYTHVIISLCIILVLLFVDRNYLKIGTMICMLFGGPIIDIFTVLIKNVINDSLPFTARITILCIGCVILAAGMSIVIKSGAGTGPNDLVAIVISDKSHRKFSIVRVIVDCCFVISGYLLGGVFGIGTIICAFLVGPIAGLVMPISEKYIQRFLSNVVIKM